MGAGIFKGDERMKNIKQQAGFEEGRVKCKQWGMVRLVNFFLFIYLGTVSMVNGEDWNKYSSIVMLDSLRLTYNDIDATKFPWIVSLVTVTNELGFIVGKLDENNFQVHEDNVRELPILVEELSSGEIGINVVLTIDRSQSMIGLPIEDAKKAASTFVELMQSLDKSAIVSFNQEPRTDHPFTGNINSLKAAISNLNASGYTAVFDAVMHSVNLMTIDLKNRAIILLTDGADNRSRHTYQEVLNALLSHEIRAFTIGLGLTQNSPEENILKDMASKTGGLYFYSPTSKELEQIYRAISQLLHHRYRVSYTTHNPAKDGTLRHVRIDVTVNRQSSSDTASYLAPYEAKPPIDPVDPPDDPDDPPEPPPDPVVPPKEPIFEVIPNPFTPNGDGYNDRAEFRQGDNIPPEWLISIMDRAGRLVKRLSHGERFWNGTNESGQLLLPGCYLYLVTNGDQILHRGLIQLIR